MNPRYPHINPAENSSERQVEKLSKINAALVNRVERSMDQQANAYSLFQTAINLESQVRLRTEALKSALSRLETANLELVEARDTAERANRFKTRFFTAVGHDLLQPLHAARLSLSAMGDEMPAQQSQKLAEQLDHSLSTIEDLLRQLLDLSKLEAGVVKPLIETTPLMPLFETVAAGVRPVAMQKNLLLTVRNTDALTRTDPLMLRRVLQNLLANAINYTDKGRVLLAARQRGDQLRIEVWDTGSGIAPQDQDRIFEEFHRGNSQSEAGKVTGFGLGLAIVQRMSEALGHRVALKSWPGRGTRFSITVPYSGRGQAQSVTPRPPVASEVYGFDRVQVVIIDNDRQVREAMQSLLIHWGCDTRIAGSLNDLNQLIYEQPHFRPALVLADYHLDNGETGLAAVAKMRSAFSPVLPGIIVTADYSDSTAEQSLDAGCELLRKPVRPAELRALMQHVLR
jgi:two-component system, sensor histidine kinase